MKKSIYLETSFISYLTARPSRDVVIAGHQAATHEWWEKRRQEFELYLSEVVIAEAQRGDVQAVAARLAITKSLPLLEVNAKANERVCESQHYDPPVICTPTEFLGG